MSNKKLILSILASSIILTGCATKQDTGQLFGAIGGGVICNQLAKNSPDAIRLMATAGCAYAGSLLGSKIGKNLDDKDQEALAKKTQDALNSNRSGKTQWASNSGAKAELVVGNTYKEKEVKSVKRSATVQPVANMEKIDAPYLTLKGANVRSAPSTRGERLALLPAMTEFQAMGKSGDWILVSRKGTLVGYVHAPLVQSKALHLENLKKQELARVELEKAKIAENTTPPKSGLCIGSCMEPIQPEPKPKRVSVKPVLVLDSVKPEAEPDLISILAPAEEVQTEVIAEQTCRSISSTVTSADGKKEGQESKACKNLELDLWAGL